MVLAQSSHGQKEDLTVDSPVIDIERCQRKEVQRTCQGPPRGQHHTSAGAGQWEGALESPAEAQQLYEPR